MASDKRPPLTMVCTECKAQNYVTTKNKTNVPDRVQKTFSDLTGYQMDRNPGWPGPGLRIFPSRWAASPANH